MRCRKMEGRYLTRLLKGEEVIESLRGFVRAEGIPGGSLTGLGAADDVTVAFWDTVERRYRDYRHQGLIETRP